MPVVTLGDAEIHYELQGNGPLVVLITGLAGVASYWDPNYESLCRHFTVLRYDQRGTGSSTRTEGDYSVELLSDDLAALMDALGLSKAALVGHSTGGAIAQVLAARRPDLVGSLVLYAAWATLCPQMKLCMEIRQQLLLHVGPAAYHRASPIFLYPPQYVADFWTRIEDDLRHNVAATTTWSILDARIGAVLRFDGTPYLDAIDVPTLVVVADDDILTPPLMSMELVRGVRNARMITIAHGAHAVSRCEPELFGAAILPFLQDPKQALAAVLP